MSSYNFTPFSHRPPQGAIAPIPGQMGGQRQPNQGQGQGQAPANGNQNNANSAAGQGQDNAGAPDAPEG